MNWLDGNSGIFTRTSHPTSIHEFSTAAIGRKISGGANRLAQYWLVNELVPA